MPGRVEVDWCVGGRDISEPRVGPGGRVVGWAESELGESAIVVVPLDESGVPDGSAEPRRVTSAPAPRVGRGLGGGCWCWSPDGQALVHAAVDGNLWWQPLDGAAARQLTDHGPERVAQAPVVDALGRGLAYVVDQSEVWYLDLSTGVTRRIDDATADFCFDPAISPDGATVAWQAWNVPDMPWDRARIERVRVDGTRLAPIAPGGAAQQPRFTPAGALACVRDDDGWNTLTVDGHLVVDTPVDTARAEHAGPTWGLGQRSYAVDATGARIAFTRNERGFGRLCVLDTVSGAVHEVGRGVHGQLGWEGDLLCALRTGARTPPEVLVHRFAPSTCEVLDRRRVAVGPRAAWPRELLVEPELVVVTARDGSALHARRYPAERSEGEPGRLLVWLHGGPTDQWQVTFMPRVAYWRAQGWDVLVPDHRGSTGHGRAYQQALRGRWGELDVADVIDVVDHAHRAGWATPSRTALAGGSAGGFTVLGVLAERPDLAAAAVVAYPVADLADLAERSHRFERHYTVSLVGPPGASPEVDRAYHDRSPVWFAHRITTPLLVLHGADDPVVPVAQSTVLAERIRTAGGDVELCVYPGEGHGFRQRDHQLDEYARTAAFLRRHVP